MYQICALSADIKQFSISLESFPIYFCKMLRMQSLRREMVMENQETVIGL